MIVQKAAPAYMWPELLFISRETAETAVFIKNDNLCTFALLSIISK